MKSKVKNISKVCLAFVSVLAITACSKSKDKKTTTTTKNVTTEAHVHSYGEWRMVSEATCTKNGKKERICLCTDVETAVIPAKGHTVVTIPKKEATCTEDGLTEGTHCSVCI